MTGRHVDLRSVADDAVDPGLEGGTQLAGIGRLGATITRPDASAAEAVADVLGAPAAADAAGIAAAFEGLNRIVDGVGLPVSRASLRDHGDIVDLLGLNAFPHAAD